MLGTAPDVSRATFAGECVKRAGLAKELERAVGGCKAEPGRRPPCALEELEGGEAAVRGLDRIEDGSTLGGQSSSVREH